MHVWPFGPLQVDLAIGVTEQWCLDQLSRGAAMKQRWPIDGMVVKGVLICLAEQTFDFLALTRGPIGSASAHCHRETQVSLVKGDAQGTIFHEGHTALIRANASRLAR